jgi:hypothetical protein
MEFIYRVMEGASTGSMLLSLFAYPQHLSSMAMVYATHWAASMWYHVSRTEKAYRADIVMINVLVVDRIASFSSESFAMVVYIGAIVSSAIYPPKDHTDTIPRITLATILYSIMYTRPMMLIYLASTAASCLFFFELERAQKQNQRFKTMLTIISFHFFLGVSAYIESSSIVHHSSYSLFIVRCLSWIVHLETLIDH